MQRSYINISDIHRHLSNAVFVNIPTYGLRTLQCAWLHDRCAVSIEELLACDRIALTHRTSLLSNVECDGIGATCRSGVKVEVDGNEEVTCSDNGATGTCHLLVERTSAEIWSLSIVVDALGNALILALATNGKVLTLRCERCSLVAIARDVKFVGNALSELARNLSTLFKGNSAYGHNGQHVCCADTRMSTMMLTHVNKLSGFSHCSECSFHHVIRFANEGYDRAVGCFARIDVKQFHTLHALYCIRNLTDDVHIAAFAEIRHTLYYLLCFCHSVRYKVSSK